MQFSNVIPAGDWGFAPVETIQREQYDRHTMRPFRGTGTMFIPVPGCVRVDAVRVGPMPQDVQVFFEMPLDTTLTRFQPVSHQGWRLIEGVDGTPLLQRTMYSNFGVWQKDVEIHVIGEWDEAVSPIPEPEAPSDLVTSPVAMEPGELAGRRGGRS